MPKQTKVISVKCQLCKQDIFLTHVVKEYCEECEKLIEEFGMYPASRIAKATYPKSQELKDQFREEKRKQELLNKLESSFLSKIKLD